MPNRRTNRTAICITDGGAHITTFDGTFFATKCCSINESIRTAILETVQSTVKGAYITTIINSNCAAIITTVFLSNWSTYSTTFISSFYSTVRSTVSTTVLIAYDCSYHGSFISSHNGASYLYPNKGRGDT